jgi:predicted anti-sigma-YlaC factor YlaD
MNCDDIKMLVSDYIDNELTKEKEAFFFAHLSSCPDCREEFKLQNRIQHQVQANQKEVNDKFEKRLYTSIQNKQKTFNSNRLTKQSPVYVNFILALFVLAITIFSFLQVGSLRNDLKLFQQRYEASIQQINYQSMQMYQLMNSMPAVEIQTQRASTFN